MKKILYIGNKLSQHGAAPTSIDILSELLKKENVLVVTASNKKNKFLRLSGMLLSVLWYYRKIDFVLIDTYSTQNFWYAYFSGLLCKKLKINYIPILRGGNLPLRIKKNPKESEKLFNYSWLNIVPSSYLMEKCREYGINNLKFLPNSITIKNYNFKLRTKLTPTLLWVRAFDKIYNPMLALTTLEMLLKDHPSAKLSMVGPDKDGSLAACKSYAARKGLPVTFTGKLKKQQWISLAASHDIFINTSNIDNTPVSVIEAMALGLPVVSTNVGGIPFLIEAGKTGMLVARDHAGAMNAAVTQLLEDPALSVNIASNARQHAQNFDWEIIKHQWAAVLS